MRELAPGLLDWTAYRDTIGQRVHSHYVAEPGVIIDPMPPDAPLPSEPRLAVLTNRHHLRYAADYGCPIRCHQAGLHEFEGSDVEVGVLCPEETALHIAAGDGFLAFADAIARDDDGALAFVSDWLLGDDAEAVKAGLRAAFARLLDSEEFDGLLLAHGDPTPSGGRAELERFVSG